MKKICQTLKNKKDYLNIEYHHFAYQAFWISFLFLVVIDCVENTSVIYSNVVWLKPMYFFRNILYLVLIAKATIFSTYRKEELIGVGIVSLIGFASLLGSGDFGLLRFSIVAVALKDVSSRKLVAVFALIKTAAITITLLLWRIGVLDALYYQDNNVGYYNTYGFCHRNVLGANVVVICLIWFYLRYRKLTMWDIIAWSGIALITYKLAISRTSLIVMVLIIFMVPLFQHKEQFIMRIPRIRMILLGIFLGFLLISILGTLFYSPDYEIWDIIDKIFTKRFYFSNYCYQEYGVSLFGQNIPFVSSMDAQNMEVKKLILDNAYMRAILYYGIIPGAVFFYAYFKALDRSIQKKDVALLVSLFIFAVYGLSERYMLDVFYQIPLLVASRKYFFQSKS